MVIHQNTNSGCVKIILDNIAAPEITANTLILQFICLSINENKLDFKFCGHS